MLYLAIQGLRLILGKALLFYAALFPPFVNPHTAYMPQLLTLSVTSLGIFVVVGAVMVGAAVWMATK